MITITDITINALKKYDPTPEQLRKLIDLLISTGVDYIELTISALEKIGDLNPNGKYILKIDFPFEADKYSNFRRYVCRIKDKNVSRNIITEIQANDIREINLLSQFGNLEDVRIVGFDDILNHDYFVAFSNLRKKVKGRIELCPENKYYCATAIAVEWLLSGEKDIAVSFAGLGSKAALEEVIMALRLEKRYKPNVDLSGFSKLKSLIEKITGEKIPKNKAVIGDDIFNIESGIHANGISKNPKLYEPFTPELVGNKRKQVVGKHSGKTALILKMLELSLSAQDVDILKLLTAVHNTSVEINSSVSDELFIENYNKIAKGSALNET